MRAGDAGPAPFEPQHIPAFSDDDQPDSTIRTAYWDGVALIEAGWTLRGLDYDPAFGINVAAESPNHRMVIATCNTAGGFADETQRCGAGQLQQQFTENLAAAVGCHEHTDALTRLDQLRLLLQAYAGPTVRPELRGHDVPGIAHCAQPRRAMRACFWLLCTLECGYHWKLSNIGEDVAHGGFIADIPDEPLAIYPRGMRPDGSDAGLLAHTLAALTSAEMARMVHLHEWHRSFSGHGSALHS